MSYEGLRLVSSQLSSDCHGNQDAFENITLMLPQMWKKVLSVKNVMGSSCSTASRFLPKISADPDNDPEPNPLPATGSKDELSKVRVLMLGAANSGKTTIRRQLRLMYGERFSDMEIADLRKAIKRSTVHILASFISGMVTDDEVNADFKAKRFLFMKKVTSNLFLTREVFDLGIELWNHPVVQEKIAAIDFSSEDKTARCSIADVSYTLDDPALTYLPAAGRILAIGYVPTDQDILSLKLHTTAVSEITVPLDDLTLNIVDMGGQRSQRKKWLHCFDSVSAVLFVVGIAEYDRYSAGDECQAKNALVESLELWGSICNIQWFRHASMILLLNKIDVLEEKISRSPINNYFQHFDGDPTNYDEVVKFITEQFLNQNKIGRIIYHHLLNAKDVQLIRHVFRDIKEDLLAEAEDVEELLS